jgi:hypothetical protein
MTRPATGWVAKVIRELEEGSISTVAGDYRVGRWLAYGRALFGPLGVYSPRSHRTNVIDR